MQQDQQSPSNTFISQWERQRDAPPSSADIEAHLAPRPWEWRWSPWIGITYGPIPIGMIVGIPLLLLVWR